MVWRLAGAAAGMKLQRSSGYLTGHVVLCTYLVRTVPCYQRYNSTTGNVRHCVVDKRESRMGCCQSSNDDNKETEDNLLSGAGQTPDGENQSLPESPRVNQESTGEFVADEPLEENPPKQAHQDRMHEIVPPSEPQLPDLTGRWAWSSKLTGDGECRKYSLQIQSSGNFQASCVSSFEDEFGPIETPVADESGSWELFTDSGDFFLSLRGQSNCRLKLVSEVLCATTSESDAFPPIGSRMARL